MDAIYDEQIDDYDFDEEKIIDISNYKLILINRDYYDSILYHILILYWLVIAINNDPFFCNIKTYITTLSFLSYTFCVLTNYKSNIHIDILAVGFFLYGTLGIKYYIMMLIQFIPLMTNIINKTEIMKSVIYSLLSLCNYYNIFYLSFVYKYKDLNTISGSIICILITDVLLVSIKN